jgi:hypothetical protein
VLTRAFKSLQADSFVRFGNDAEQPVIVREKRCAGERQGAPVVGPFAFMPSQPVRAAVVPFRFSTW